MGSPVKLPPDEIAKLNNYSDKHNSKSSVLSSNNNINNALRKIMPVILPISEMHLNKIPLGMIKKSGPAPAPQNGKKPLHKSRKGSNRSINLDTSDSITRMVFNINIAKRKLIFEFDIDRNHDEDGMMEEESSHVNQFDDG